MTTRGAEKVVPDEVGPFRTLAYRGPTTGQEHLALVRGDPTRTGGSAGEDLFGYGAREAVMAALRGGDPEPFGRPAEADDVIAAVRDLTAAEVLECTSDDLLLSGADRLVVAVAFAHGWVVIDQDDAPGASKPPWLRLRQSPSSQQSGVSRGLSKGADC